MFGLTFTYLLTVHARTADIWNRTVTSLRVCPAGTDEHRQCKSNTECRTYSGEYHSDGSRLIWSHLLLISGQQLLMVSTSPTLSSWRHTIL